MRRICFIINPLDDGKSVARKEGQLFKGWSFSCELFYSTIKSNDLVVMELIPLQFFPSPVKPKGHGPQLIISLFLKQVTLGQQESSVQFTILISQFEPVKPAKQLHVQLFTKSIQVPWKRQNNSLRQNIEINGDFYITGSKEVVSIEVNVRSLAQLQKSKHSQFFFIFAFVINQSIYQC